MSESAAGTLESEKEELLDQQLLAKWEPYLDNADSSLRDAIIGKIKKKQPPPEERMTDKQLREMSQEEVDRKFKEMTAHPEIKRPEDLYKVDAILKNYMEKTENAYKEIGDDSLPPGEVLWKTGWEQYGWNEDDKKKVSEDLKKVLDGLKDLPQGSKLDDNQTEMIMEIMLSNGLKPENLANLEAMKAASDSDFRSLETEQRREYKYSNDIFFLRHLGVTEKQLKHFVLTDVYEAENEQEIYYGVPKNIEDLAWQIMHTPGKRYAGWGIKGERPLLEMRIATHEKDDPEGKYKKGEIDTEKSRYRVNTANMVAWARYGMYVDYDRDREDPKDFFQSISLQTRYPLSFNQMLLNPDQYFKSEDGLSYSGLMLEWYKEAAVFSTVRSWDVAYRLVAGDPDELAKVFREMYNTKNLLTRGALGSNIMGLMTTMPLDYGGTKEGKWESDNVMGAAWIDIYRAYDSLADYEGLKKVLGTGSQFFTQKGWEEAIREVAKENVQVTGVSDFKVFFGLDTARFFEGAFDKNGEISTIENRRNFIKFLNIFGNKMPGAKLEFTVRAALRNAIAEKYGQEVYVYAAKRDKDGNKVHILDEKGNKVKKYAFVSHESGKKSDRVEDRVADNDSLKLAEAIAWSLARPFGACAKNDPDAIGHDWMARVYNSQLMRQKYPHRGDKFGNEYNMMQFKRTGIDAMNGIVTEAAMPLFDEEGRPLKEKNGMPKYRKRTPMEIFIELSDFKTLASKKQRELEKQLEAIDPKDKEARARKIKEIEDHDKEANQRYRNMAQQVSFNQRTLSNYWEDHLHYGIDLFRQLTAGQGIDWQKVTDYNVFGGVRLKTEEFQKEVQDKWIHKIRYMIETYPSINLNQKVRVLDQTATNSRHWDEHRYTEPVYHEVTLGEAMFGHDMLNRPEFWKRDDKGKPILMKDKKGRKMKGLYEIDYQKVQDDKQLVWKQWFMMQVAGEMRAHRDLHANDTRYNFTYYQNAIEALAKLPENIIQDEYKFNQTEVTKHFFNKADIAWLRNKAGTTSFDLYWKAIAKDIFLEDKPEEGLGILTALSLAMKAIIREKV